MGCQSRSPARTRLIAFLPAFSSSIQRASMSTRNAPPNHWPYITLLPHVRPALKTAKLYGNTTLSLSLHDGTIPLSIILQRTHCRRDDSCRGEGAFHGALLGCTLAVVQSVRTPLGWVHLLNAPPSSKHYLSQRNETGPHLCLYVVD